jgi:hypothetical protein
MANSENVKRTPEEFAKNYPRFGDGLVGQPIAIGNINEIIDKNGNKRILVNLCMKTTGSGDRNAVWSTKFNLPSHVRTGAYVQPYIENGYVKKLIPMAASASMVTSVNEAAQEQLDQEAADKAVDQTIKEAQAKEASKAEEPAKEEAVEASKGAEADPF